MATLNVTSTAPFGAIATFRALRAVETAIDSLTAWNASRLTKIELGKLSTRQLEDIGLGHSQF